MPPTVALLICIGFVLHLLSLDRNQATEVSLAAWIPTIWMLSVASKPMATWLGVPGDPSTGSAVDRVFLSALLCLGLGVLGTRSATSSSQALRANPWLVLLLGYMLVSVTWSHLPSVSFKRWVRELIAVVMALVVLSERNPRQTVEAIFRRSIYVLIPLSLVLVKYFPEYGIQYHPWSGGRMWIGAAMQKNGLGRLCAFAVYFLMWTFWRRSGGRDVSASRAQTWSEIVIFGIAVWLLKGPPGAYPATAVIALGAALVAHVTLVRLRRRRMVMGPNTIGMFVAFLVGFGIVTVVAGGTTVAAVTSGLGRNATLTGRTSVWMQLLPLVRTRLLVGGGFGSFWTSATREYYAMSDAHSGYLDLLLELGSVGVFLVVGLLMALSRKAEKELLRDFDWAILSIALLVMCAVHNITESSVNSLASHLTAIVVFVGVTCAPTAPMLREVPVRPGAVRRPVPTQLA